MYAVSESGENIFAERELYTNIDDIDVYSYKTNSFVYKQVSKYNVLSGNMNTVTTIGFDTAQKGLTEGAVVRFKSLNGGYWQYGDSASFTLHIAGSDENGETVYSLSPVSSPKSRISIAKSTELYIRCASGGTVPTYKICSAANSQKVLTLDDGNVKARNFTGAENQEWVISLINE